MRAYVAALIVSATAAAQLPAPALEWSPWVSFLPCGGAQYSYSVSKDDGRNDIQVKLRVHNMTDRVLSTRFTAWVTSESGEQKQRQGRNRLNPGPIPLEGGAFYLGAMFPSAVNQIRPTTIRNIELEIEAADISRTPSGASPSTYLDDFRHFPREKCPHKATLQKSPAPAFVKLTRTCYGALPRWTQECNQAVDALVTAYEAAPESAKACILEWRQFQKCFEVYAFEAAPAPKPQCEAQVPRCSVHE